MSWRSLTRQEIMTDMVSCVKKQFNKHHLVLYAPAYTQRTINNLLYCRPHKSVARAIGPLYALAYTQRTINNLLYCRPHKSVARAIGPFSNIVSNLEFICAKQHLIKL